MIGEAIQRIESAPLWAIEPHAFEPMLARMRQPAELDRRAVAAGPQFERVGRAAVVPVSGILARNVPTPAADALGLTSLDLIDEALDEAVADSTIDEIVLRIDSPGGLASAWPETAQTIRRASESKPVVAFIDNLGASAAYALSSQASEIVASPAALIGSIGTMIAIRDSSKLFERTGVDVHVVTTGTHKATGYPGTKVTAEHLGHLNELVAAAFRRFAGAVRSGRNLSPPAFAKIADGRLFPAEEAVSRGLVDRVSFWSDFKSQLENGQMRKVHPSNRGNVAAQSIIAEERQRAVEILDACHGDTLAAAEAVRLGQSPSEARAAGGLPGNFSGFNDRGSVRTTGSFAATFQAKLAEVKRDSGKTGEVNPIAQRFEALKRIGDEDPQALVDGFVEANRGLTRDEVEAHLRARVLLPAGR